MCWVLFFGFVVAASSAAADTLRLLEDHGDAWRARVEAIRAAREQIVLSTFIIENDQIGLATMAELRAAARRGVAVRVLLDAGYNRLDRRVLGHLLREGLEIREYHPFRPSKPLWITRRMHDKLLIADSETLILGGRNVSNPYFGLGEKTYVDRDVLVGESQAVTAAQEYFDALWRSEHVAEKLGAYHPSWLAVRCAEQDGAARRRRCEREREKIEGGLRWAAQQVDAADDALAGHDLLQGGRDRQVANGWASAEHHVEEVRFVHDAIGAKASRPGTALALREVLAAAHTTVLIESPYLVPSRAFRRELELAFRRGVSTRILTNSLNTTDNLWPQAGYVGEKLWLRKRGVDLWEQIGEHTLHSKSAVIDQRTVVVGSFNLDPRSQRLNREVLIVVDDTALAAELSASMQRALSSAWQIGPDGIPVGYDERYPGIGWWKKVQLRALRLVTPLLRKQL